VKLPEFLRDMLKEHLAVASPGGNGPDDLVFTTKTGAPIRQHLFYRRHFKPAVRKALPARLHGLRFHDLRHTCASLLLSQGAHALAVKEWLGHSSIQITVDRYGHLLPGIADDLAAGLDTAFAASANGSSNVEVLHGKVEARAVSD